MDAFQLPARVGEEGRHVFRPRVGGFETRPYVRGCGDRPLGGFFFVVGVFLGARYKRRLNTVLDRVHVHDALVYVGAARKLVHGRQKRRLQDAPQAAGAGAALQRELRYARQGLVRKGEVHLVVAEELPVLAHERVLGLGEDTHQVGLLQATQGGDDRQTPHELRYKPVLQEVLGQGELQDRVFLLPETGVYVGAEADALLTNALADDLLEAAEGAAADEQDVLGVYLQKVLVRVLAPVLRRHGGHRALQDLEQSLLYALARDVARDRGVVRLAGDLVYLVYVDDPGLRLLHVEVGGLDKLEQDILHVLAYVAGLGKGRGVGYGERDVEDLGERLGQKRLAGAGRTDQQDVGLLQLGAVRGLRAHLDALVVVVDGDGQDLFRVVLADHVLVEDAVYLPRLGEVVVFQDLGAGELLVDDLVAQLDALVADIDAGAGYELPDLALALTAEGALQLIRRIPHPLHPPRHPYRLQRPLVVPDDVVDDAVLDALLGAHDVVAVGVALDPVVVLAGVLGEDLV